MTTTNTSVATLPAHLPALPEGYDYVGQGPLLPLAARGVRSTPDQPSGHLAMWGGAALPEEWVVSPSYGFSGQSATAYYAVRRGTHAHALLFPVAVVAAEPELRSRLAPAHLPTMPEGYDYVGFGAIAALEHCGTQPCGDLALFVENQWWCPTWMREYAYTGRSHDCHYVVRRGSAAHRLIFPEPTHMTQEPDPEPEPETEDESPEVPEGHTLLDDGRMLPTDQLVEVVVAGSCSCSNGTLFYGKSWGFKTAWHLPDDEEVVWLEAANCYAHAAGCELVGLHNGEWLFHDHALRVNGEWYHNNDVSFDGHGNPYLNDDEDYVYCSDEGESYHRDECHYCEDEQEWRHGEEEECSYCTKRGGSDYVNPYHGSPKPEFYRPPFYPPSYTSSSGELPFSGWGVGFEVEKNSANGADSEGDYVGETPLFAGWERDASCGVEGITHVYDPLRRRDLFLQHVKASAKLLNAPADSDCGGHINISHANHTPRHLLLSLRVYAPLWYALYRNRLNNAYCRDDKKVEHGTTKYSPLRTKDFGVEFRLPYRVRHAVQLVRRFDLIAAACTAIDEGWSLNRYVKECRPLLLKEVYGGDRVKYAHILRLTRHFDRWFKDGHIHSSIVAFV